MANYLFIYRGGGEAEQAMSAEQMQSYMQKWHQWIGSAMEAGWMTTPGDALLPDGCVVKSGGVVSDGPFAESKEIVGGYSIIQADSLSAAAELAKDCPGFDSGGCVEVRPLANVEIES